MMSAGLLRVGERRRYVSRREHQKVNQTKPAGAHQRADLQYRQQLRTLHCDSYGSLSNGARDEDERGDTTKFAREGYRLWEDLPAHDVLFFPVTGPDLVPLQRASGLADVLLFADWRWPESDGFDRMISELLDVGGAPGGLELIAGQRGFELPAEQVQAITGVSTDFGLFSEPAWVAGQEPWGRITRLKRSSGAEERLIWLVYITGNAVQIYKHLFVERRTAPKVLWLDCPLGADLDGWPEFISPGGLFGHVFTRATQQPKYVVAQRYQAGWKQSVECQRLPAWHPAWELTLFALPEVPMGINEGRSGVSLSP
jgi:hypothetical protein